LKVCQIATNRSDEVARSAATSDSSAAAGVGNATVQIKPMLKIIQTRAANMLSAFSASYTTTRTNAYLTGDGSCVQPGYRLREKKLPGTYYREEA